MILFIFLNLIITNQSQAQVQTRTNLFKKEPEKLEQTNSPESTKLKNKKVKLKSNNVTSTAVANIPFELQHNNFVSIEESPVILPSIKSGLKLRSLNAGDLVSATILESVFAFQESKAPVRAVIDSGSLKGSILIGEANLERNSKRILIDFKKIQQKQTHDIFQLQASAMDYKGILGLKGEIVSNESIFFSAEVIAAAASGYADSTIERNQNSYGNSIDSRNEDTFAKKAITSALSKTADRFSEKLKQAPEYSVLEGPVSIQILILDMPKQINE